MDTYEVALAGAGIAILGAAIVPRVLSERPLSFPAVYVLLGIGAFSLPLGLDDPDPIRQAELAERLAELVVIVALTAAGLKIDRRVGWRSWQVTWRLLALAMPLTIALVALLGWWALGLTPAAALLLGAAIAPTDPVLASDVQVGPPQSEDEDETRFALTSEAGLNDGLAFPFTNAAIAAVGAAGLSEWFGGWVLDDLLLKTVLGVAVGFVIGRALAWTAFRWRTDTRLAKSSEGFVAVAVTFISYGVAELAHGYGFLAVFVAALTLRDYERDHEYHDVLHGFIDSVERLLMALLLVLLGGAVAGGILRDLTWEGALVGLAIVLLVRPLVAGVSLLGSPCPRTELAAIAFFGIRGVGSLYYLAHAASSADFLDVEVGVLWSVTVFIILVSVVLHGSAATPVLRRIDAARRKPAKDRGAVSVERSRSERSAR
jgi:sodium/hydrogen antiporter